MDNFYTKENINDFSAWLAASAAHDAFYKIHPSGGFLFKQDMGAMQLLYIITSTDLEFISAKMRELRSTPLNAYNERGVFRSFVFICDFFYVPAGTFVKFLEKELDENSKARVLTEFIIYDFHAATYARVGGGRIQDKYLRKILEHAAEAARLTPEERQNITEQKKTAYRETLKEIRPQMPGKRVLNPLIVILIANVAIYFLDLVLEARIGYKPIEFFGIQYSAAVWEGDWWRLLISMFLHADFSHLMGNMLMLVYLSSILRNFYTDSQYWIIYLTSGLAGNLLSLIFMDRMTRTLGASGAIMGLGGVLIYRMFFGKSARAFRYAGSYFILAFMVGYNLIYGLFAENINNFGHYGGFITGFLLAMLYEKRRIKKAANRE